MVLGAAPSRQPKWPSPLFWFLSVCYGPAASAPTSSARISVLPRIENFVRSTAFLSLSDCCDRQT